MAKSEDIQMPEQSGQTNPELTEEQRKALEEQLAKYEQQMKEQFARAHYQKLIRTRKVMKGRKKGRKVRLF